ncbi:MAG: amidohydrolase [Acidimicrobiales bacterium]
MSKTADLALFGGVVRTLDPARPLAEAIAVSAGRIVAVGSQADIRAMCGPATETIDLGGRLVLPGFQDAHVHPPMGGVEMLRCDLTAGKSRHDYLEIVGAYAASHPDEEWIRGGGWHMPVFPGGLPLASDLDAVVGNRAVYLPNRDHHSGWASSRALDLAGISATTPDPPDGRIERDAAGSPTGALHEGAMTMVERLLPALSKADFVEGLVAAQAYLHSLGITAWQDAWVTTHGADSAFEAYVDLDGAGRLTARVVGALWWERDAGEEQVEELLQRRADASVCDHFRATSVKIMQDGVCETFTAAMLNPYLDSHGHETDNCGLSFVDPEALKRYVTRLDSEGFQVHIHAIGDRAVREALDAVAAARSANGASGLRHHLAHLQVVHPSDVGRFAPLDVVANFQPLWACADDQMVELTIPYLGEVRAATQYPIGSIARLGGALAFGSDWPVSSPDPLAEMEVAVTRCAPAGFRYASDAAGSLGAAGSSQPLLPAEAIDLGSAVRGFTSGSAFVNNLDDCTGTLEVGKFADLAVLDRDIFTTDAADGGISGASVVMTMVGGLVVFEAPGS